MAKPTDLPVWASDTNYPAGVEPEQGTPTKVEPISSKQALGWRPEEKPKAQSLNWWQHLVYQWVTWINNKFEDEPVNYSLTGNVTADFTGTGNLNGVETVRVTPDASGRIVFGVVGGEDGKELLIVNASSDKWFYIRKNGTVTAGADIDMPATLAQDEPLASGALSNAIRVYPKGAVRIRYDGDAALWRLIGASGCKRAARFALAHHHGIAQATGVAPDSRFWNLTFANAIIFQLGFLPHGATLAGWKVYVNKITSSSVGVRTFMTSWRNDSTSSNQSSQYENALNAPGITQIPSGGGLCVIDNVHNVDSFGEVDLLDIDQSYNYVIGVNVNGTPGGDDLLGVDVAVWVPF